MGQFAAGFGFRDDKGLNIVESQIDRLHHLESPSDTIFGHISERYGVACWLEENAMISLIIESRSRHFGVRLELRLSLKTKVVISFSNGAGLFANRQYQRDAGMFGCILVEELIGIGGNKRFLTAQG